MGDAATSAFINHAVPPGRYHVCGLSTMYLLCDHVYLRVTAGALLSTSGIDIGGTILILRIKDIHADNSRDKDKAQRPEITTTSKYCNNDLGNDNNTIVSLAKTRLQGNRSCWRYHAQQRDA